MNLEHLCRLADLAAESQELSEVFAAALDAARAVMGADRAAILVPDDLAVMRYRAWHRLSDEYRAATNDHSPSALGASTLLVPDVGTDPSLEGMAPALKAEGVGALALVPVVHRARVLGQLAAYYDTPHAFSDGEVSAARLIARQIALGLERARVDAAMAEAIEDAPSGRRDGERSDPARRVAELSVRRDAELTRPKPDDVEHAWGEFLSILGHELRNPLNAIVNAARVLETPGARDDLRTMAHAILDRQVARLARLLDDLLDESRISRGLVELQIERFDLRSAATLAAEEQSHGIAAKKHALHLSLPDRPVTVIGDPFRIRQVISNLLDNAIKFTPAQGSIAVDLTAETDGAVLRVRDSGVGIAADRLTAIFQPFVHASPNSPRSGGGLGLGLSLVKRIVDLHGGSVRAESSGKGMGTEMIVCLPFAPPGNRPATLASSG